MLLCGVRLFVHFNITTSTASHIGTKANPWKLKTTLLYKYLTDLHKMLKSHDDWMELGSADEQKPAKDGTVEALGRSESNPNGGWYGLKKGLRDRCEMYIPPLMEVHFGLHMRRRDSLIRTG